MGSLIDKYKEYDETLPKNIFDEYEEQRAYKSNIGAAGIYDQTRENERFNNGEQWEGEDVEGMPTPVMNVIRQVGGYKIANLVSNPIEARFSFEGVPSSLRASDQHKPEVVKETMQMVQEGEDVDADAELNAVAQALTEHTKAIWERVQMDLLNQRGARKAWISGSYVLYSPFNPDLNTGMYAGEDRKVLAEGDIDVELLDITNVYFGNPAEMDVQKQPFIIVSQRKSIRDIMRLAKDNEVSDEDIEKIKADSEDQYESGNVDSGTSGKDEYVTLLIKLYRKYDGKKSSIWCTKVVKEVVIVEEFDTEVENYPIAIFQWEERDSCIYGHTEITELISNQVAINKMSSLQIIGTMLTGLPKIIYNEDIVTTEITNSPGEIIPVRGNQDVQNAFRYVNPSAVSPNWDKVQQNLIDNTKIISGANNAALGEMRPDNTSAIVALREAATLPLQPMMNRFFGFIEQVQRIWGELILKKYGKRMLKIRKDGQVLYVPFDSDKYKDNILSVRIDVGLSTLYSASTTISTLTNFLKLGALNIVDVLERMPDGYISGLDDLIESKRAEIEEAKQATQAQQQAEMQMPEQINPEAVLDGLSDEELAELEKHPEILQQILGGNTQV